MDKKINLYSDVSTLRGVGEARRAALSKMGIETVYDVITCYPRAYQNRGDTVTLSEIREKLKNGENGPFSVVATVSCEPKFHMIRRGMTVIKFRVFDESDSAEITYFNMPYLRDAIHTGAQFRFFGKFTYEHSGIKSTSPIYEPYYDGAPLPDIVPVYPLSSGITQKVMSNLVGEALKKCLGEIKEYMPSEILREMNLPTYRYTLANIHHPESLSALETAKRRLVFDELYMMFLSINLGGEAAKRKNRVRITDTDITPFLRAVGFELTGAQFGAIGDIISDMSGDTLMNRMVTGDVGCGKTVVAAAAAYAAVKNGYRAAIMAPTEILAKQHYGDLSELFSKLGIRVGLIVGGQKKKERDTVKAGLLSDIDGVSIDIVIGTHALISEGVEIRRLGLAVIDEQHRFGVMQRAALFGKNEDVHCLAMSATPIPRTLTLAAYGSVDVSKIDELPRGRQKIDTFLVNEGYRERLNGFIRKQAEAGHQTYVVCPAVEEADSDKNEDNSEEMADIELVSRFGDTSIPLKAATEFAGYLSDALPGLNVGFVHGKMKSAEREEIMLRFSAGEIDVLVSTTVIEVGVNVPNATLMIVENAERFGLAQLHQLRGRVGRGKFKSFFVLVSDTKDAVALERLRKLKNTSDGFEIAEYDLEMRGPGDFFSDTGMIRQHGQVTFRLAAACRDTAMIERAAFYAKKTAVEDPNLSSEQNRETALRLEVFSKKSKNTIN